jgi:hypothetical protein
MGSVPNAIKSTAALSGMSAEYLLSQFSIAAGNVFDGDHGRAMNCCHFRHFRD